MGLQRRRSIDTKGYTHNSALSASMKNTDRDDQESFLSEKQPQFHTPKELRGQQ